MFMPLHIAIREVIEIYGLSILSDRLFINYLSDYGAFTEVEGRADKRILEDIATDGFFQKLYYSVSGQKEGIKFIRNYAEQFSVKSTYGPKETSRVFSAIAYGCRLTDEFELVDVSLASPKKSIVGVPSSNARSYKLIPAYYWRESFKLGNELYHFIIGITSSFLVVLLLSFLLDSVNYKYRSSNIWEGFAQMIIILVIIFIFAIVYMRKATGYLRRRNSFYRKVDFIEEHPSISYNLYLFSKGNCLGIFDSNSKTIVADGVYSSISRLDRRHCLIKKDKLVGLFGIYSKKIVLECVYENISELSGTQLLVGNNNLYGVYDSLVHKFIVPVQYDNISLDHKLSLKATRGPIVHLYDSNGKMFHEEVLLSP